MNTDNTNQTDTEVLEIQAKQIAGLLDVHAKRLSMRTMKQLEDGRARAVKAHAQHTGTVANADGTLSAWLINHRIVAASLALTIVASGFMVFSNLNIQESGDAFILGADLPPEAFVDRGFEPSLNKQKKYL